MNRVSPSPDFRERAGVRANLIPTEYFIGKIVGISTLPQLLDSFIHRS